MTDSDASPDEGKLPVVPSSPSDREKAPRSNPPPPLDSRFSMDDREKKLVIYMERRIEQRVTSILRQESGDSYGGLPADHVLVNLDREFPEVHFPERMMARLETEQRARVEREARQDAIEKYEAETRRLDADGDRRHLDRAANRAVLVLVLLLCAGVLLTLLGHDAAGITVLGTTLVGVIGAFLKQQFRPKAD